MSFAQARLEFDPTRDGFSFPNAFRWTETDLDFLSRWLRPVAAPVAAALPAVGATATGGWRGFGAGLGLGLGLAGLGVGTGLVRGVAQRWPTFGLCGGMALVAAQRWPNRVGLATAELQPEPMRRMLWRQQAETLRASGATFLRLWLKARAAGQPTLGREVLAEWRTIRARIDAGRPVVLGLVGDAPDLFAQHQVLAYGYAGADDRGTITVYDPNRPGEEKQIAFTVVGEHARITTDLPVGPTASGHHVSTRPGRLDAFFGVDV